VHELGPHTAQHRAMLLSSRDTWSAGRSPEGHGVPKGKATLLVSNMARLLWNLLLEENTRDGLMPRGTVAQPSPLQGPARR